MKYDVFISYSRKDTAIADRICSAFDKAGITYFIDRQGIGGGFEFPVVLAEAIIESQVILFLASKNSYESKFTNAELTFAFNEKPKNSILPYVIDGSTMPPALRFVFSSINWRTIDSHPIETTLISDILTMLRGGAAEQTGLDGTKIYKVGDYYNENGKEGVVFWVDETGKHGKIVSMKQSARPFIWAENRKFGPLFKRYKPSEMLIGELENSHIDGVHNMSWVRKIEKWCEKYPAFAWCADFGDEWYLPAMKELSLLLCDSAIRDAVNRTIEKQGGEKLLDKGAEFGLYWSSTEYDECNAWGVNVGEDYTFYSNKHHDCWVRAIAQF